MDGDPTVAIDRRRALTVGITGGLALVAGCTTDEPTADRPRTESPATGADDSTAAGNTAPEQSATSSEAPADDGPTSTARTATDDGGPTEDQLDLREANVVAVDVASVDGGYRFSVTLHHDDAGEDGYADWWQVETVDGERLGRRELLHAHGTEPFTRSTRVDVPGGAGCVVVRGHDQVHGYGGRAVVVDLASGETWSVSQGSARRAVTAGACSDR